MFATPPRLRNITGPARPAVSASARWNTGASGAPCPPAAMSSARKSQTTAMPRRSASCWPSPICTVSALRRIVKHGLAVEADKIDVAGADPLAGEKGLDRLGMAKRDQRLRLGEHARPGGAVRQRARLLERLPKKLAGPPRRRETCAPGRTPRSARRPSRSARRRRRRATCRSSGRSRLRSSAIRKFPCDGRDYTRPIHMVRAARNWHAPPIKSQA